jgi:hypothetical protein
MSFVSLAQSSGEGGWDDRGVGTLSVRKMKAADDDKPAATFLVFLNTAVRPLTLEVHSPILNQASPVYNHYMPQYAQSNDYILGFHC